MERLHVPTPHVPTFDVPTRVLLAGAFVLGAGVGAGISQIISKEQIASKINQSNATQDSGASPIIIEYGKQVRKDMQAIRDRFSQAGLQDLSGKGYDACVVPSDCLAGEETCVAGTKPNVPQAPGYCVPINPNE